MAAAITQLPILDAQSVQRLLQAWSSTGLLTGNLNLLQMLVGADLVNPVSASNPLPTSSKPFAGTPLGYQQLTGMSGSTALTVPGGTTYALIMAEAVDVRWRDDGVAPTSSVGMQLFAGNPNPSAFAGDLAAARFIQTAAGAILNVSYYA